ncbi:PREDICTED: V-set and immunoglobulin domain-containing protein 10-like isoform X2 [Cyprinodon variegatus]|uniref:V-set and immunoglobulin domain-containing protein 10-like isoform X2 n=1 Tax=Cyprinodon variegatus TaxID=28743 RepID=UPI000742A342|nr:PREDICTED: V-set and immunoglobulin domain-containing protein 10-like isoform X2 [Cyprinodon variegatus]
MKQLEWFQNLSALVLIVLSFSAFQGIKSQLVVSPVGPTLVNVLAGSNVTLAVSFSGATDPVVIWFNGSLTVGTWTINANFPPDIVDDSRDVLRIEKDGSLTFTNVPKHFSGIYTVNMTKSGLGKASTTFNLRIYDGPDEPIIEALPAQPFYEVGDSVIISCNAEGFPQPTAEWVFGGQTLSEFHQGILNLTNVQTNQGGVYTCSVLNAMSGKKREKNVTITVYERPLGDPTCSVLSVNNTDLQYQCRWVGGTPNAQLTFPDLSTTSTGAGIFSLTVTDASSFDEKTVVCNAEHPIEHKTCSVTASRPMNFLPAVKNTVDPDGQIAVTIYCVSDASPQAVVSWSRGGEEVINGTPYQISSNTTQLKIRSYNISTFLLTPNFTCTCRNPLGSQKKQVQLQGPSISDSSLFPNEDGSIITLTWEVPPTSIVTGFDIQMKGPDLLSNNEKNAMTKGNSNEYRIIQQKPGSARSADIFFLDPDLTYRFRIIPKARLTDGEPSEVHRIGPGEGLSGPAIAGIAAGIPCSILTLFLIIGLIVLIFYLHKKKSRQTRYPVSRAVEKVKNIQPNSAPHKMLNAGLRSPPDYNRLHQTPSERSGTLPTFVPPPPVRVATTV